MDRKTVLISFFLIVAAVWAGWTIWSNENNQAEPDQELSPNEVPSITIAPDNNGNNGAEAASQTPVTIFLSRQNVNECNEVFPVQRTVTTTPAIGQAALNELLKGPSQSETEQDYLTNIPEGVVLRSLIIRNGVATADFNAKMNEVAGSCRVTAIRTQITQTLMQFPTINEVVISVEGEVETALQP